MERSLTVSSYLLSSAYSGCQAFGRCLNFTLTARHVISPKASGRYRTTPTDLGCGHQNPLTLPSPELRLKWVIGPFGSLAHALGTIFLDQFRQPRLFLHSRNS